LITRPGKPNLGKEETAKSGGLHDPEGAQNKHEILADTWRNHLAAPSALYKGNLLSVYSSQREIKNIQKVGIIKEYHLYTDSRRVCEMSNNNSYIDEERWIKESRNRLCRRRCVERQPPAEYKKKSYTIVYKGGI
jgi:hypothetical protein